LNPHTKPASTNASDTRRKNQWKLMGIFGVAGIPVLLAMTMYFGNLAVPAGKTNKGELLTPIKSLVDFGFVENTHSLAESNQGKWLLIQTGAGECTEQCQEMALMARQVNILMAREQERVARILISSKPDINTQALKEQFPKLSFYQLDQEAFSHLDGAVDDSEASPTDHAWHLWISDPLGNVILRYDSSHTGYDLKDDLKKLLKLSNIG